MTRATHTPPQREAANVPVREGHSEKTVVLKVQIQGMEEVMKKAQELRELFYTITRDPKNIDWYRK